MNLPSQTISFSLAQVFPVQILTRSDFRLFEEILERNGVFTQSSTWSGTDGILQCFVNDSPTNSGINNFTIKLVKIGERDSPHVRKENLYLLAVSFDTGSDHNDLVRIYPIVVAALFKEMNIGPSIISREAVIRILVGPFTKVSSFSFIWNDFMAKPNSALDDFGPWAEAGGIRIVGTSLFTLENQEFTEHAERDFRFESYFPDPNYAFIENTYRWQSVGSYGSTEEMLGMTPLIVKQIEYETKRSISAVLGHLKDRGEDGAPEVSPS